MRFIKMGRQVEENNDCERNFIAAAKVNNDETDKVETATENLPETKCPRFSFRKIVKFITNEVSSFRRVVNRKMAAASLTVVASLIALLIFNVNFTFAYTAFVDGVEVGFVPDKAYVQTHINGVNTQFSQYISGQNVISDNVVCVPTIIRRGAYTDVGTLTENIKATSPIMTQAYAVEVDGVVHTALSDEALAEDVLTKVADSYKLTENTEVYFQEEVNIVYEYVPMAVLTDSEGAYVRLMGYTTLHHTVTVDSVIPAVEFASGNYMDIEYFEYLNPDVGENIEPGEPVLVPQKKPVVTVMTADTVTYDTVIPYKEELADDATMYEGTEKIVQSGVDGVNTVTEKIVRSNGKVVNQMIIYTEVINEPVTQLRLIGTMPRPDYIGTGSFVHPYNGQISSRFGQRSSGYHTGLDLCGNSGDPIVAADNGIVVFSDWSGGYGNVVKIDHGNGYVTYYAHCSELKVENGDVVSKGQLIATVGSTGNSTGPHLHFEIRYEDEPLNPLEYIE